jgi:uncharacterized protein (DUF433 family)
MRHERISQSPAVMVGKPVVKGTRITVEMIVHLLGSGWSEDQILEDYPHIAREDIRAALLFAADYLRRGVMLASDMVNEPLLDEEDADSSSSIAAE